MPAGHAGASSGERLPALGRGNLPHTGDVLTSHDTHRSALVAGPVAIHRAIAGDTASLPPGGHVSEDPPRPRRGRRVPVWFCSTPKAFLQDRCVIPMSNDGRRLRTGPRSQTRLGVSVLRALA